ncbi:CAP-associated domain-containing protein [Bacillus salitolerans]|uniref:CAP-associated domain-containing protein n=1 Tax=Bacillus salitolerans TaxID=1437434 RepID=A0ABW4LNQ6_9BACI
MKKIFLGLIVLLITLHITTTVKASPLYATDYTDYQDNQYWSEGVKWAVEQGIMKGYSEENLLKPFNKLSEAQYITMYLRYFVPGELQEMIDLSSHLGHWATPQYILANQYQLSVSNHPSKFDQAIRRGDTALLLAEGITGTEMTEEAAVQWLYEHKLSTGYADANGHYPLTYESYKPNETLTRAQGVVFLYRFLESELTDKTLKIVTSNEVIEEENKNSSQNVYVINGIQINDERSFVEEQLGEPKRITDNEYGLKWYTYYQNDYENFLMVGYDGQDKVALLYTNQDLIKSKNGISLQTNQTEVRATMETEPLSTIHRGDSYDELYPERDYDVFLEKDTFITFFYDVHEDNTLTSLLLARKDIEEGRNGHFGTITDDLYRSYEYQVFDLTNSYRKQHNLHTLQWDEEVAEVARAHSKDMAIKDYFEHINLEGLAPAHRIDNANIPFSAVGENIAVGYYNSLFVIEAWMNSSGHRKNMLRGIYEGLGVGIYFGEKEQWTWPYFTQNFITRP